MQKSASLRGCELKYEGKVMVDEVTGSASLRGCELKYPKIRDIAMNRSQPPCEAVN